MVGLWRSLQQPDINHPYGFMTEKYAWAMVSGVGVFFLGGGVTLYHGIMGLLSPTELLDMTPALYALLGCFCFEISNFN
jgi:zinc transporter 9